MANHGFVTTRKHLTVEKIDADIRRLAAHYFGPAAAAEGPEDCDGMLASWWIYFNDDDNEGFSVWLMTKRKLEFRHPLGSYGLRRWGQQIFTEELAAKYEGRISDQGWEGYERPDVEKINTYRKWVDLMLSCCGEPAETHLRGEYFKHLGEIERGIPALGEF